MSAWDEPRCMRSYESVCVTYFRELEELCDALESACAELARGAPSRGVAEAYAGLYLVFADPAWARAYASPERPAVERTARWLTWLRWRYLSGQFGPLGS